MKKFILIAMLALAASMTLVGCDDQVSPPTSSEQQQQAQETLEKQSNAVAGMPAVTNFREKKLLKAIIEMRDKAIPTYTYIYSPMQGKFTFVGDSIGYGIPYATEYTNPQQVHHYSVYQGYTWVATPQADPNGLYSPDSAEGTWVLMKNDATGQVTPQYMEERINVFDHKLPARLVIGGDVSDK